LRAEWDFELNTLDPSTLPPKSNYHAHWVCKFGHHWEATVVNRTHNKSGCPDCRASTSRLEVFLLCELRAIFSKVLWRKKVDGFEVDILIPHIKIGVEVDGSYWHRDKAKSDAKKNKAVHSAGYHLVRVREVGLPSVGDAEIRYGRQDEFFDLAKSLMKVIEPFDPSDKAAGYANLYAPLNEAEYGTILSRLPGPPEGETLADIYPDIAAEWDDEENNPFTPDLFSPGSDQKFAWICTKGHRWQAVIKNRTLAKSGCPECALAAHSEVTRLARTNKHNSLAARHPEVAAFWDYDRNQEYSPKTIASGSNRRIWWRCENGHPSYLKSVAERIRTAGCPLCLGARRSEANLRRRIEKYGSVSEWLENTDLRLVYPPEDPDKISTNSRVGLIWECEAGHRFKASPKAVFHKNLECGQCKASMS